jgi:hypothetical protein
VAKRGEQEETKRIYSDVYQRTTKEMKVLCPPELTNALDMSPNGDSSHFWLLTVIDQQSAAAWKLILLTCGDKKFTAGPRVYKIL